MPDLRGAKQLCVDLENRDPKLKELGPGVRRRDGYVVGLAVGTDTGVRRYLPVAHEGGDNLDPDLVWGWARDELNAFEGDVVGAQLLYDLDWLASHGITFPRVRRFLDVQNAEPLIDENRFRYGLEYLAADYLNEGKVEGLLRQAAIAFGCGASSDEVKGNLWRLPARFVGPYAEGDVDLPLRILPLQLEKLTREDLLRVWDLECRLVPLLLAMRRRGVRIDEDNLARGRERLVADRARLLSEVRHYAGPRAELLQPETLVQALRDRGIEVPLTNGKKPIPSITAPWLDHYAKLGDPLCAALRRGRQVNTVITTFFDGLEQFIVNGRVHPLFHQLKGDDEGTIARFSCTLPNLQNQPARDEELGPLCRRNFVPEVDCVWESNDYSQIEYRFLAHYALGDGADECRRQYNEEPKTDFHKLVATWLGVDPEDKIRRKRVKNTNFAKGYGARAPKLAETFGCSVEEAQDFIDEYDAKLPFAKTTFETMQRVATNRGWIKTIMGRRRRFEMWEPARFSEGGRRPGLPRARALAEYGEPLKRAKTYAAMNACFQGGAADLMKKGMVDAWEAGVFADDALGPPHVTVHDELGNSVPATARGEEAAVELKHYLETAIELRVPVLVSTKRGANWGDCE
jgi:DNA polymerase I-like protein with 3'-5' exonuclease and polymerase domains